jgi:hypothetical protein
MQGEKRDYAKSACSKSFTSMLPIPSAREQMIGRPRDWLMRKIHSVIDTGATPARISRIPTA